MRPSAATARANWERHWNEWPTADSRIAAAFFGNEVDFRYGAAFAEGGVLRDSFQQVISAIVQGYRRELAAEVVTLRLELAAARAELKALKSSAVDATEKITSGSIDRKRYRVTLFYDNGKPGPTLNVRELFEQYFSETAPWRVLRKEIPSLSASLVTGPRLPRQRGLSFAPPPVVFSSHAQTR